MGVSPRFDRYGSDLRDQTFNLLQLFLTLSIRAISGLNILHNMGYCVMALLFSAAHLTLVLSFL